LDCQGTYLALGDARRIKRTQLDFLTRFSEIHDHPAIVLWKSIEVKNLSEVIDKISCDGPTLDLGCGEGKVSSILFNHTVDIGLDIDRVQVRKARLTKGFKDLVIADGDFLPFAQGSIGLVLSNCVIEHIPNIERVLREVSRVLRKKGYFVFTVPSKNFATYLFFYVLLSVLRLKGLAHYYGTKRNEYLNHYNIFSEEAWIQLLKDANLNVVMLRQYLSKSTMEIWDLLAFLGFLWRKLHLDKLHALMKLSPEFERTKIKLYTKVLKRYYLEEQTNEGGGLLIVAQICD